jgi:hypothetical protein
MPDPTSDHFRDLQRRSAQARKVNTLERRIRELVDSAPPLTEAQRDRLATLLRTPSSAA